MEKCNKRCLNWRKKQHTNPRAMGKKIHWRVMFLLFSYIQTGVQLDVTFEAKIRSNAFIVCPSCQSEHHRTSCEVLKHTVGIVHSISFILQGTFPHGEWCNIPLLTIQEFSNSIPRTENVWPCSSFDHSYILQGIFHFVYSKSIECSLTSKLSIVCCGSKLIGNVHNKS